MVKDLGGSVVTITGGTGSFGTTMALHLLQEGASQVRILSRDEAKQDRMRHELSDPRLVFFIGDTRDASSLESAIRGSDYVFHAAALKQVPSAEFFPLEAVKTNIDGSANVIRSAYEFGVKGLVCLSTDKAVYPINAMGMSKALMEKTVQAFARSSTSAVTKLAVTRYGNVMYSRGSVIPLFISQIKAGKPITITNPNMTRFLMSLDESVSLVSHALRASETGDIFVRKAPAGTMLDLGKALLGLFGKSESQIEIIGSRHGEKLFESLLSQEEAGRAEDLGEYYRVPLDTRDLNYSKFVTEGETHPRDFEAYTSHNTERLDVHQIKELLLSLKTVRAELDLD